MASPGPVFQVSPGVAFREIDLTNSLPATSLSTGAIAGSFNWGPVEEIVTVNSEKQLTDVFGTPTDDTAPYFFPAAQFLLYSASLRVVRTANAGQLNSTSGGNGLLVKNETDYENKTFTTGQEFVARNPGELGNAIGVLVATSESAFTANATMQSLFSFAPGTSDYAEDRGALNDEMHVVVYDRTGAITGTPNSILETYEGVSQASDAKTTSGASNYYKDVINRASRWVWVGAAPAALTEAGETTDSDNLTTTSLGNEYATSATIISYNLAGGTIGTNAAPSVGELSTAYDLFNDTETSDVNFIIGTAASDVNDEDVTLANYLIALAESRKDAIALVSPGIDRTVNNADPVTDVKAWADGIISSSYGVMDSTALYVYDKYNDKFRWIVAAGAVAGLCSRTDEVATPWTSPAGMTRGQIRGITRIAYNPKKTDRDTLYKARVNPIVTFPGEGTVLFGDKTALKKPSAFDRINVRRLFITLQKVISGAARYQLFDQNDEFSRAQFRNLVNPFLRTVQGQRGIIDFRVVCDASNNDDNTNDFVADIYIQPTRSINFITLNFIAVRDVGISFNEIAG